jgi:hypothetical protein
LVGLFIEPIRAVAAAALAAVASFEMVLFGKAAVAFGSKIVVALFERDFFPEKTHITKIAFSYLGDMFVVVNKFILSRHFDGVVLWPFIVVKRAELKKNPIFMNHERIHLKQQVEMLLIFFFLWYFFEYLIRLLKYGDSYKAYNKICFEREAYANEKNLKYRENRPFWNFLNYL